MSVVSCVINTFLLFWSQFFQFVSLVKLAFGVSISSTDNKSIAQSGKAVVRREECDFSVLPKSA